ncbi:MAG: Hsp20/alpha crystallin family protein [Methanomicrobiales archaeon]|nr:Hsp20/alpha crystallin family protein [Methanomicrobiales archaeon]
MVSHRRYRFHTLWNDFDDMMAEMEDRFASMLSGASLLPERVARGGLPALPSFGSDIRIDVRDHEDEVIVVVDLPGVEKEDLRVRLMDPATLLVSCERKMEKEEEKEGYYLRERKYGSMSRSVPLPSSVTEEGTAATFKNGVLEVRLKKVVEEKGREITIE